MSLYDRGMEQLKAGNFADARKLFDEHEASTGTAKATREQLDQAEAKLSAGDVNAAVALFEKVLEKNPGLPETYFGLARAALFLGKADDARTHATAATKLAPSVPLAWTLLGLSYEAAKDPNGAVAWVLKGAELGPQSFLCQFNAGRLLTSLKQADQGLPYLLRAAQLEPKNPDVFNALGYAHRQLKQYEKALAAFEKVKDLVPKSVDAWATLADQLFEVQEFAVAKQILDLGLKTIGDHPALLEKALACAMITNQTDAAIDYVERELKVVPDHQQGWLNLAGLYLLKKDFVRSEAIGKQLTQKFPNNWEGWQHLGNLYEAVPKPAEAEEAYKKAIALAPSEWKPLTNLAALWVQGSDAAKHQEAKALLEKAIQLAPENEPRPEYNLALAYVKLGDKKRALQIAKKLAPRLPEAQKLATNLS